MNSYKVVYTYVANYKNHLLVYKGYSTSKFGGLGGLITMATGKNEDREK